LKNNVKTGKPSKAKRQSRAKLRLKILNYWNTNITLFKISELVGCRETTVKLIFIEEFGADAVKQRSKDLYRRSKLGNKNPMKGKFLTEHHNWIGRASDKKGYFTVVTPNWYDSKNKRIFEHHYILAKALGISKIPIGFEVHHIDENGENNNLNNLCLVYSAGHHKIHELIRKKCNDQSSDVGSSESKRITPSTGDDMV
jgi:hypothetical protein